EDSKFYKHWGVDLKGILRALITDLKTGNFSQGASTISQQLARNLFLTLDKKIARKIKEVLLAIRIENNFSKDEILEMYLNKISYGPGVYGIEAAAKRYFDKEAKELTLLESATIVGLPQLPSYYYPIRHPMRATKRRNIVLRRMATVGMISLLEYERLRQKPLGLNLPEVDSGSDNYFIEHIRIKLEKKYGTNALFAEGMKIYTTLDLELQEYADSVMNNHLTWLENDNNYEIKYADFPADTTGFQTPYLQGGVLSIEPQTGFVRVMIGGRNFKHSKWNRIIHSRRQPGSSFKPIIYSAALSNGYTPSTIIQDEKISFIYSDTLYWNVHNYSRKNYGYIRMRDGLKHSRNIYSVKMVYDLTPQKVVDFARRFGLSRRIYPVYSISIGTIEVDPLELISSYTAFPNDGYRNEPIFIRRVEDSYGNVLFRAKIEPIKVLSKEVAYLMTSLMGSVLDEGTGRGVRWRGYKWSGGGKTGTTDDFKDAWFIGYNKKLVTGIWVGFDDNRTMGRRQTGSRVALPIWPYIMKRAIENESPNDHNGKPIIDGSKYDFKKPNGIVSRVITKRTGLLPRNDFEPSMVEEYVFGTQPTPLSDSLEYNFYPTMYRMNHKDSLVIDLGGKKYVYPDSGEYVATYPDSTDPSIVEMVPKYQPNKINLSGAKIIKNHRYVSRQKPMISGQDSLHTQDSLYIAEPKELESELSDEILEVKDF
ncbi:MAG: PBP1A family penicillin-binding protein, partial [Candidatus Cloacimonadota bacterium]|nr:PBP1A family penicillin-binding protein [Candidatus Cloacimonadota bacterium]